MINFPQRNWTDYGGEVRSCKVNTNTVYNLITPWMVHTTTNGYVCRLSYRILV